MKTVIIILGSARSGSTLLAKSIGGHSKGFALGEINRFNNEINNPETHCGCADKLSECDFWNDIISDIEAQINEPIKGDGSSFQLGIFNQLTKNKKSKLLRTIFLKTKYKNELVDNEIDNTILLYNKLLDKTESKLLIDSSKGLFRSLVLTSRTNKDIQIKFIHLIRNGKGVVNSSLKSSYNVLHKDGVLRTYKGEKNKDPLNVIKSWLYINLRNFLILKMFYRNKTTFIRYEDFTNNPSKYLTKIYKSVNLDYEDSVLILNEKKNHIMGGNSSRINANEIRKQDDTWVENLDKEILKKFNRRAGWFNVLMGY